MTALVWGADAPEVHSGLDRGLIYHPNHGVVPWNGLVAVGETSSKEAVLTAEHDGMLYANLRFGGVYQASVSAYDFPEDLIEILGLSEPVPGFFLTGQQRELFDFSYRTLIGENDYLIHLVYNALLTPTKMRFQTTAKTVRPSISEWRIDALPPAIATGRPTAHLVIDSRLTDSVVLDAFQDTLYGTDITNPDFPTQQEVISIFVA